MIKAIANAISAVFRYFTHRSEQQNREDVISGKRKEAEAKHKDEVRKAIREKDTDEMRRRLSGVVPFLAPFVIAFALAACTTVKTPVVGPPAEIAWDAGEQNAGVLGWTDDGWMILTPRALDRYQSLLRTYGSRFTPPLDPRQGIRHLDFEPPREDLYLMDAEHVEAFATMRHWQRNE